MDIRDHQKALATFRRARSEFSSDPQVRVYVDQTIPVLEAHLKMAQNLHHTTTTKCWEAGRTRLIARDPIKQGCYALNRSLTRRSNAMVRAVLFHFHIWTFL